MIIIEKDRRTYKKNKTKICTYPPCRNIYIIYNNIILKIIFF